MIYGFRQTEPIRLDSSLVHIGSRANAAQFLQQTAYLTRVSTCVYEPSIFRLRKLGSTLECRNHKNVQNGRRCGNLCAIKEILFRESAHHYKILACDSTTIYSDSYLRKVSHERIAQARERYLFLVRRHDL